VASLSLPAFNIFSAVFMLPSCSDIEGIDAFADEIRVLGMESLGFKELIRFGKGEHKTYI